MHHLYFGQRLIKTAIAVYITAQICYWLGWPMIFAVISAIVSIEPTVNDSIRKGIIRFPSAAIGAAFAMIFDAWLGPQPITFTLSAISAIYVINLLKWNQTIVISTLTAVNMISVSESHFLLEFFVRLGTTMTGITVSAAVNYLLFRPNYISEIENLLSRLRQPVLQAVDQLMNNGKKIEVNRVFAPLQRVETLLHYQISDSKYKRTSYADLRSLARLRRQFRTIQNMKYFMQIASESSQPEERRQCLQLLESAVTQLKEFQSKPEN